MHQGTYRLALRAGKPVAEACDIAFAAAKVDCTSKAKKALRLMQGQQMTNGRMAARWNLLAAARTGCYDFLPTFARKL